jgi:hypothetical protein
MVLEPRKPVAFRKSWRATQVFLNEEYKNRIKPMIKTKWIGELICLPEN